MHHFTSTPGSSAKSLTLYTLTFPLLPLHCPAPLIVFSSSPPPPTSMMGQNCPHLHFLSSLFPALFFLGRQTGHIPQGGPGALFWHVSALHPSLIPLFLLSSLLMPPIFPPHPAGFLLVFLPLIPLTALPISVAPALRRTHPIPNFNTDQQNLSIHLSVKSRHGRQRGQSMWFDGWQWRWFLPGSPGPRGKDGFVSRQHRAVRPSVCAGELVCLSAPVLTGMVFKHKQLSAQHLQARDSSVEEDGKEGRRGLTETLRWWLGLELKPVWPHNTAASKPS